MMNWKLAIKDQRQTQLKAIQAQLVKTKIAKLTNLVDFKIHIYTTLDLQAQLELLGELI